MYWPCGVPKIYAFNGPKAEAFIGQQRIHHNEAANGDGKRRSEGSGEAVTTEQSQFKADDEFTKAVIGLRASRNDQVFVTITRTNIAVWQTRPTAVLAAVARSQSSLNTYGSNVALLLRPDSAIAVVQTQNNFLLTYSITTDAQARVYQQQFAYSQARRQSVIRQFGDDDATGLREVSIRFRMAIKIDAGISKAIASEQDLLVATIKPAAVQGIKWIPDKTGSQTANELLGKMEWMSQKSIIADLVHDRAMSLSVWVMVDGRAYAVQRNATSAKKSETSDESQDFERSENTKMLFHGHCFHEPSQQVSGASLAAINARFSILALSCENNEILIYSVKDYAGNIPPSHKVETPASITTTGKVTVLAYSPDGYCLFVGFEKGWAMWSVFGKPLGNSFNTNRNLAEANGEAWLLGVSTATWVGAGSEVLLTAPGDYRIWKLDMARSAATGCFSCANLVRAMLQTPSEVVIYRGHDLPDLTTISGEASLWHHALYPPAYLHNQWPIKTCVISQDGRYVAVAGRRGLAHYSVQSGRWKTFSDLSIENSFSVRGGMCWYGHILIAATESDGSHELRLYSRDLELGRTTVLYTEALNAPVIFIGPSGEDSLLVYTYENVLFHFIINLTPRGVNLVMVGHIAFHEMVRAPARVRAVSWILPDSQLRNGDPSHDVAVASVLFLNDDKLVLLQPSQSPEGSLKYDMRVIAQHIEYYILMRDQLSFNFSSPIDESVPPSPSVEQVLNGSRSNNLLRDSLWTFSGNDLHMWSDVSEVLHMALEGPMMNNLALLSIPVDFYPLSILLNKGVVLGSESETIQRRDVPFAILRFAIRTHLFIPYILRHQLSQQDMPAALGLAHQYKDLSYFAHALEILLHHILDEEVDRQDRQKSKGVRDAEQGMGSLLPTALAFLQSSLEQADYLSTIVQCTRKTELRSWQTLFAHLPPPTQLFEESLQLDSLKTAGGYLLVLQGLDEDEEGSEARIEPYVVRLMRLGKEKHDWDLCTELAGFMVALDPSGEGLRRVMKVVGFGSGEHEGLQEPKGLGLTIPSPSPRATLSGSQPSARQAVTGVGRSPGSSLGSPGSKSGESGADYFSASPGEYRQDF
ncbi:MAG: hypothetical protein Q9227_008251 [Pyrenula ochraceoflavens]